MLKAGLTHADQRSAVVQHNSVTFQTVSTFPHDFGNIFVERVAKRHVAYHSTFEECKRPHTLCAVNNLIWDHKIPRLDHFLQTTNRRKGNDCSDTDASQRRDIGSIRYFMRRNLMVRSMPTQKCDGHVRAGDAGWMVQDGNWRGRLAPGSIDIERSELCEPGEILQARASDYRDADLVYFT